MAELLCSACLPCAGAVLVLSSNINSRHARVHHPPRGLQVACAHLKHRSKDPPMPNLQSYPLPCSPSLAMHESTFHPFLAQAVCNGSGRGPSLPLSLAPSLPPSLSPSLPLSLSLSLPHSTSQLAPSLRSGSTTPCSFGPLHLAPPPPPLSVTLLLDSSGLKANLNFDGAQGSPTRGYAQLQRHSAACSTDEGRRRRPSSLLNPGRPWLDVVRAEWVNTFSLSPFSPRSLPIRAYRRRRRWPAPPAGSTQILRRRHTFRTQ